MRLGMTNYAKMIQNLLDHLDVSQTQLGERLGVSQGTISRWRGGGKVEADNRVAIDQLAAEIFDIPRPQPKKIGVAIVGFASAGNEQVNYGDGQGPFGYAKAPEGASDETVAVLVRGTSLGVFFDGWVVYYDERRDPPTEDLSKRLCVVGLSDDQVFVKILVKADGSKKWHLFSNGGAAPILNVDVAWAAPVIGLRPPDAIIS